MTGSLVFKSKPRGSLSIAHGKKPIVVLKVLFEFVPYLDCRFFRYDEPRRIEAISVAASHGFKRRKELIVILSFRKGAHHTRSYR